MIPLRSLLLFVPVLLSLTVTAVAEKEKTPTTPRKDRGPMLRFIIVSCPPDQGPLKVMSKNDEGEWREHAEIEPRPSFITDWVAVAPGKLHLTQEGTGEPVVLGSLDFPAGSRRAIAVLFHDSEKNRYRADVIDPAAAGFRKGSTLMVNYSSKVGAVSLGNGLQRIEPGSRRVIKPKPDDQGMYRMLASYAQKGTEPVLCYDRYVADNPDARDILLLLPDQTLGLRVFRLSEFGPFD